LKAERRLQVDILSSVQLKVAEAKQQSDVGRSVARIDSETMKTLGLIEGEVVEIIGKKSTPAKAFPAYPEDQGSRLLRIDGFIRKNCNVSINEFVSVKKAEAEYAQLVKLAPVDIRISVDNDFVRFVKDRLMDRPTNKGDTMMVMMLGHSIPFMVVNTRPDGIVKISPTTEITILGEPVPGPYVPTQTIVRLVVVKNGETFEMLEGEQLLSTATLCQLSDGAEVPVGLALWFTKNVPVKAS
jgi:transitional endoplasmic reticulum ATPase